MCKPKFVGGLGVQRLDQFNNACLAKLGWKIINDNKNWWVQVVKQKHLGCFRFWPIQLMISR